MVRIRVRIRARVKGGKLSKVNGNPCGCTES